MNCSQAESQRRKVGHRLSEYCARPTGKHVQLIKTEAQTVLSAA
jgi:hypothetical protein